METSWDSDGTNCAKASLCVRQDLWLRDPIEATAEICLLPEELDKIDELWPVDNTETEIVRVVCSLSEAVRELCEYDNTDEHKRRMLSWADDFEKFANDIRRSVEKMTK